MARTLAEVLEKPMGDWREDGMREQAVTGEREPVQDERREDDSGDDSSVVDA